MENQVEYRSIDNMIKILIIDNEADSILFKEYLNKYNFKIDILNNYQNVVLDLKSKSYDLILLDVDLPGFNGLEIVKLLSKRDVIIPVIITTKNNNRMLMLQAFKLGVVDYIMKPLDLEELKARINAKLIFFNII